jgi:phosphate starvation-inducible PhoH-like protein
VTGNQTRKISLAAEEDPSWIYGRGDENLRYLSELSGVTLTGRGGDFTVTGEPARIDEIERFFGQLEVLRRSGQALHSADVRYAASVFFHEGTDDLSTIFRESILVAPNKKHISPRTSNQRRYLEAVRRHDIVFGVGPAGTGKTYLAVAMAVGALLKKEVTRIILTRPAVEAGERLGFLPGDLLEKVHPYLRPLYDALYEMIDADRVAKMVERGTIEIAPLAFMRGRTLNDSFIIMDEAQNTTSEQMMMFLTRLGFDSKAVITGDVTQIDLPSGRQSGLVEAQRVLADIEGIEFVTFTEKDVVRHELVKKIILAYEARTKARAEAQAQQGAAGEPLVNGRSGS